ncbi:MAG TPA: carbohydrate kinase [Candidatus Dormibacteraeota bacterium]|nr:carbohydrate kinase [Candidatus Dormibacteraeota bacterium]
MIVVCGEALIDRIRNGAERVLPGGSPFNTARALARLGVPVAFMGHLSTDAGGHQLATALQEDGVDPRYVTTGSEPSTTALAYVDAGGVPDFRFVTDGTSAPNLTPAMVPNEFDADVEAIVIGSLGLLLEPMADTIAGLARREHGKRVLVVDPNVREGLDAGAEYTARLTDVLSLSTIVKASDYDLAWVYPDLEYEAAAEVVLSSGPRLVVVTLGEDGAYAAHGELRVRVPARPVQVVDTIGAGDAFGAALLCWLREHDRLRLELTLDEAELRAALDFACLAAAIDCSRGGGDPPHRTEMNTPPI